jgi:hypothetical protein
VTGALGVDAVLRRDVGWRGAIAAGLAACVLAGSAARPLFSTIFGGRYERVAELRKDDWRFFRY